MTHLEKQKKKEVQWFINNHLSLHDLQLRQLEGIIHSAHILITFFDPEAFIINYITKAK